MLKVPQILTAVCETTTFESPIIFLITLVRPEKSPGFIFGTLLSLYSSSKRSFFSFQFLSSSILSYQAPSYFAKIFTASKRSRAASSLVSSVSFLIISSNSASFYFYLSLLVSLKVLGLSFNSAKSFSKSSYRYTFYKYYFLMNGIHAY